MDSEPLDILERVHEAVSSSEERATKAGKLAEIIKSFGGFRWVGVYDVDSQFVSIIAWSGPGAPAHPTFPITSGLTSAAIEQRRTIVVADVRDDSRYLTAFGSTLSEIIVPVLDSHTGRVIGTIDVESEFANAFSDQDQRILEQCASAALELWANPGPRE